MYQKKEVKLLRNFDEYESCTWKKGESHKTNIWEMVAKDFHYVYIWVLNQK